MLLPTARRFPNDVLERLSPLAPPHLKSVTKTAVPVRLVHLANGANSDGVIPSHPPCVHHLFESSKRLAMLISTRLRFAGAIVFALSHRGQAFLWFCQQAEKAHLLLCVPIRSMDRVTQSASPPDGRGLPTACGGRGCDGLRSARLGVWAAMIVHGDAKGRNG